MTQALQLDDRCKVLEIGTGSGYQAAVLARLARRVYTVERYRTLAKEAETRFEAMRLTNIVTRIGDGTLGWPEQGSLRPHHPDRCGAGTARRHSRTAQGRRGRGRAGRPRRQAGHGALRTQGRRDRRDRSHGRSLRAAGEGRGARPVGRRPIPARPVFPPRFAVNPDAPGAAATNFPGRRRIVANGRLSVVMA